MSRFPEVLKKAPPPSQIFGYLTDKHPFIFADKLCFLDAGAVHQLLPHADIHEGALRRHNLLHVGQHPLHSQAQRKSTRNRRNQLITQPITCSLSK